MHGVALQDVRQIDKVNFDEISSQFLPHIAGLMLKKRFEDIQIRESRAAMKAATIQPQTNGEA